MRLSACVSVLTHRQCERTDPARSGGLPPIRFVKAQPDESDAKIKKKTVTIKMDNQVKAVFETFTSGDAERAIELIRDHQSIVSDRKLEEKHDAAQALCDALEADLLNLNATNDADEIADINKEIEEHKLTCVTVQQVAFDLFEKLLDPVNIPNWRKIVANCCDDKNYVDLNGKRNTSGMPRGRVFDALKPCYFAAMLPVSSQDAAERHKRYWGYTVKMADSITVEEFIDRVIEANDALPYLPSLKQRVDSPDDWPTMEPFSTMELCMIVINALPGPLQMAYWARQGEHFPTDLTELKNNLKYLEIQVSRNKKSLDDLRRTLGPGTGQGNASNKKGNNPSGKGDGGRIPKKADRAGTAAGTAGGHGKKHCVNCAKWSAGISHTHNTSECRKWNSDGTQKGKTGYQGNKGNYSNTAPSLFDTDYKKAFAQQAKEMKSIKKMMLQQSKAIKRSRKRNKKDSSDSDSSDSD